MSGLAGGQGPSAEAVFRASFEQSRQPTIILDDRGIPALWNTAFEELFLKIAGFVPDRLAVPLFDWLEERESFRYSYYVGEVMQEIGRASCRERV